MRGRVRGIVRGKVRGKVRDKWRGKVRGSEIVKKLDRERKITNEISLNRIK